MTPPVAIITGSAQRIGKALALALHAKGYNLVLHYFNTSARALAEQLNESRPDSVTLIQADLNDESASQKIIDHAINTFNKIDVLVNNASSFYKTPIGSITHNQWHDLFNTNAAAPFFLCQSAAPYLKAQQGCIVNIADVYAQTPKRNHTVYCMAKAANAMLTKSLAVELAPEIRVNGIAPGAALWPGEKPPANEQKSLSEIPLGRVGGAEAMVETMLFLIDSASYITGQIIPVDGGKSVAGIA